MKIETNQQLKIKLVGDDIDKFKSAINKIKDEQKKIGFKSSSLTEDEIKVIDKLSDNLNK
jgi:hypothetical protein